MKSKHNISINIFILLVFLGLSIINVIYLYHFHTIHMKSLDMSFHWQRVGELIKNNSLIPNYATNLFSGNGSAVMSMYPYLFLYPFAFLYINIKSIIICSFIMFIINTFLTLLVSYYSSLPLSHNRFISLFFAIFYSISSYITAAGIGWSYIGELYAFIFMPLIIFGFIYYLKRNKWIMLSIGMTLTIYSSVIMAVIIPLLLFIWLTLNYRHFNKNKIIALIKAILLTTFSSALFIIPVLKIMIFNKLNTPKTNTIICNNIGSLILTALGNNSHLGLTIYSILGIITGIIIFKHLTNAIKQSYIMALFTILLSSNFFPWFLFDKTLFKTIQYTGRMLLFPQVILTYVLSIFIYKLINKSNHIYLAIIIIFISVLCCQLSNQQSTINEIHKCIPASNAIINRPTYQAQIHHMSAFDYYPTKSLKYKNNLLLDKGFFYKNRHKHIIQFNLKGNGIFRFKNKFNIKNLYIPFLYYNKTVYKGSLNNQPKKLYKNKMQILSIKNINKGQHQLHINILTSKTTTIARILTLLSLPIYFYLSFIKFKKYKHQS